MLVHYKIRNGVLHLGRWRIYGISTGHPPTDIPWEMFRDLCSRKRARDRASNQKNPVGVIGKPKDVLVQATYRASDLQRIFKRGFSEIAFQYDELDALPNKTLQRLADEMGLVPKKELDIENSGKDRKHLLELIKRSLREASPNA